MRDPAFGAHLNTLSIHAGSRLQQRSSLAADHAADRLAETFSASGPDLSVLEERVAALEDGTAAVAFPSIEVARLATLQALMQPGDEVVVAHGYGEGRGDPLEDAYGGFGWQVRRADPGRPESLVEALSDRSKAIVVETLTRDGIFNDIAAIARVAGRARLPLVVDNTLATPCLVRPFQHGADVVLHDARAYLGGFKEAQAALVVDGGRFDWTEDARFPAISGPRRGGLGIAAAVGNFAFAAACRAIGSQSFGGAQVSAVAILHGIETLPLRMERHCDNALAAARFLERHPAVRGVSYAGLDGDPGFALARQGGGAGGRLSFVLANDRAADRFTGAVRLFAIDASGGGSRSAIVRPAAARGDASGGAVRLAIGLEGVDDIVADLAQALAA